MSKPVATTIYGLILYYLWLTLGVWFTTAWFDALLRVYRVPIWSVLVISALCGVAMSVYFVPAVAFVETRVEAWRAARRSKS